MIIMIIYNDHHHHHQSHINNVVDIISVVLMTFCLGLCALNVFFAPRYMYMNHVLTYLFAYEIVYV